MIKRKSSKKHKVKKKPSQSELNDALVAIIASTKRKKRKLNPLHVAEKIQTAWDGLDSLSKVGERTGMSAEMLRQIHSVRKCSEQVKKLVRERKLESYDILHRISKLPAPSQVTVAKDVIAGKLDSEDVRAIVTFHKDFPSISVRKVIERIKSSRNIKQYIVHFEIGLWSKKLTVLRSRFNKIFGKGNVISLNEDNGVGELILNSEGKNRLQKEAKLRNLTKRELIRKLVAEK